MRDRLAPLFPYTFAVVREPPFHGLGLSIVNDALPETGSAVGVYSAVLASPTERVLCVACDMPFVTPHLLWALAEQSEGFDVFVPKHGGHMQPLCAVYGKGTLDAYREFIRSGAGVSSTSIPTSTPAIWTSPGAMGTLRSCSSTSPGGAGSGSGETGEDGGAGARRSSPGFRPS